MLSHWVPRIPGNYEADYTKPHFSGESEVSQRFRNRPKTLECKSKYIESSDGLEATVCISLFYPAWLYWLGGSQP